MTASVPRAEQPSSDACFAPRTAGVQSLEPPWTGRQVWLLRLMLGAALALVSWRIAWAPPLQSANDRSRWCTVWSLTERGTYCIDEIRRVPGWDTIDLVRVDGHFFSTKPPLMATWVAGLTWLVTRSTGWDLLEQTATVTAVVLWFAQGLPFVMSLSVLSWGLRARQVAPPVVLTVVAMAAFATLQTPFVASLNNHTPASVAVLLAIAYGWLWQPTTARDQAWSAILAGLFGALAAAHDLPAALVPAGLAFFVWQRSATLAMTRFAPAAATVLAVFLLVNWIATGSIKPTYADYGSEKYEFIDRGVPSYWAVPQGIDRNLDTPPVYAWHALVGHHGWFSLTPLWILVLWPVSRSSPWWLWQRLAWGSSLIVLAFYLSRTGNYNYGGVSCALRWALFLTPLWLIALVPAITGLLSRRVWGLPLLVVLTLASLYSAWEPGSRPWQQPWLFRLGEARGWFDYREPPPPFPRPLLTWLWTIPAETSVTDGPVWIEFEDHAPGAPSGRRLRVELQASRTLNGRQLAPVVISEDDGQGRNDRRELLIDTARQRDGRPPAECLVWTDAAVTIEQQQRDLALFRGLPLLKEYQPGFIRYLHTPLRSDALECQRAAAQVDVPDRKERVRSDVWLCPEVPFGTARWDVTRTDLATGEARLERSWIVGACSPAVAPASVLTVAALKARRAQGGPFLPPP